MSIEEMNKYLMDIQNQTTLTKTLSAILTIYNEHKKLEEAVVQMQEKMNEIIININSIQTTVYGEQESEVVETVKENAAPVTEERHPSVNDMLPASEITAEEE